METFVRMASRPKVSSTSPWLSLQDRSFSTIQAASPAGESFRPTPAVCGLVRCTAAYAPSAAPQAAMFRSQSCSSSLSVVGSVTTGSPASVRCTATTRSGWSSARYARDAAPDVAAGDREALVAEDRHELRPEPRDRDGVQHRAGRVVGVAEPGHVRHDDVERVVGVAAVGGGVGQQRQHVDVAPEGVGPAVAQQQRQRRCRLRAPPGRAGRAPRDPRPRRAARGSGAAG